MAKVSTIVKRVPKPVWLAVGGATLGLGYALYRDKQRRALTMATAPGDTYIDPGTGLPVAADTVSAVPSGISYAPTPIGTVQQVPVGVTEPAETVGAVGQTAIESVGGIFDSAVGAISTFGQSVIDIAARPAPEPIVIPANVPDYTGLAEFIRAIPSAQPPPAATPAPPATEAQKTTLPAGYSAGNTILGKTFPNAAGWRETTGPGDKANKVRTFIVRLTDGKMQGWHYDQKTKKWHKSSG